jgi:GT2 family glycosyltransferase
MNLFIVIVLYNQKIADSASFKSLLLSLESVSIHPSLLLYDNSAVPQPVFNVPNIAVTYHHNPQNGGVGEAYNYAAKKALEQRTEWLMLLDQDTVIDQLFFQKLVAAINNNIDLKLLAPIVKSNAREDYVISPCRLFLYRGFREKNVRAGIQSFKNRIIINSGAVINVAAFFEAGGYNPAIKLDFSDTEFFYRFSKLHRQFFLLDSTFTHDLSVATSNKESLLLRHNYYVAGASHFARTWGQYISLLIVTFHRSLVLSWRFKNISFMKVLVENFKWRNGSSNTCV